jgi:hypothetical protein
MAVKTVDGLKVALGNFESNHCWLDFILLFVWPVLFSSVRFTRAFSDARTSNFRNVFPR